MSEQDDIGALVRAIRARVPMDAAQMLVKETPERIGAVLAELPQILVDLIKAYLPPELRLQASESLAEVIENTVGEMMDPALAVLPQATTVQEAIAFLPPSDMTDLCQEIPKIDGCSRARAMVCRPREPSASQSAHTSQTWESSRACCHPCRCRCLARIGVIKLKSS
jgi:magnesium transporter